VNSNIVKLQTLKTFESFLFKTLRTGLVLFFYFKGALEVLAYGKKRAGRAFVQVRQCRQSIRTILPMPRTYSGLQL